MKSKFLNTPPVTPRYPGPPRTLMVEALFPAFKEAQRAGDEARMRAITAELHYRATAKGISRLYREEAQDAYAQALRELSD